MGSEVGCPPLPAPPLTRPMHARYAYARGGARGSGPRGHSKIALGALGFCPHGPCAHSSSGDDPLMGVGPSRAPVTTSLPKRSDLRCGWPCEGTAADKAKTTGRYSADAGSLARVQQWTATPRRPPQHRKVRWRERSVVQLPPLTVGRRTVPWPEGENLLRVLKARKAPLGTSPPGPRATPTWDGRWARSTPARGLVRPGLGG